MKQLMLKSLTQRNSAQTLPLTSLYRTNLLTSSQSCGYRTVVRFKPHEEFQRERLEYKQKVKEMRKKHLKEYWET